MRCDPCADERRPQRQRQIDTAGTIPRPGSTAATSKRQQPATSAGSPRGTHALTRLVAGGGRRAAGGGRRAAAVANLALRAWQSSNPASSPTSLKPRSASDVGNPSTIRDRSVTACSRGGPETQRVQEHSHVGLRSASLRQPRAQRRRRREHRELRDRDKRSPHTARLLPGGDHYLP